jgi:hypothetical protein
MTSQTIQAAFPAATGRDEDTGWIIDRRFLSDVTERVWRAGSRVSVTSVDVQTILLAAIELAPVPSPLVPPMTEEQKTDAALQAEIDAFLSLGKHPAGRPLMRAIGISIDPEADGRRFTVEVGQIDPVAVPLSEILKLGPSAGLLADLTDSLCATLPIDDEALQ